MNASNTSHTPAQRWIATGVVVWSALVLAGTLRLAAYANTAGETGQAVTIISASADGRHRLLMFAHPRCPCTTASLKELARVMASANGKVEATVYFFCPADADDTWMHGALYEHAVSLTGVRVVADPAGALAKQSGAATSGDVVLFDHTGKLRYHGGITAARGHAGDNRGSSAVMAIIAGTNEYVETHPVFGCGLFARPASADLP